jgi:Rhodanese-like domain
MALRPGGGLRRFIVNRPRCIRVNRIMAKGHDDRGAVRSADLRTVRELMARGAQLVEVLPEAEYRDEHLPGAINLPLKRLDADAAARLDRGRPVIVYCWDSL